jgi:branched-chain amino acid transport system substrate-binding protein
MNRRRFLTSTSAAAAAALAGMPLGACAQSGPIPIGFLGPLTGAGGSYGPEMQKAVFAVAERINQAGGIQGRPLQVFYEDDQTNPEAAVRGARKLLDVHKVVAMNGTWASAVTLAVKPLCVEARVFQISVSGADAVTQGNHGGYIARTQPNTQLQGKMYAKFVLTKPEWRRVAYMALQTPFAVPFGDTFTATLRAGGATITDSLIYEAGKPSYRSEVTRVLATNPDFIMLSSYTPDATVMAKELYKAGFKGGILGPSFAINAKFIEGAGAEVADGVWSMDPAPSFGSPAYKAFAATVPRADQNPYAPQSWDHMTLIGLALLAARGEASGTGIKDHLREISNPPGAAVHSFEEGARLLKDGKKINYEGASGTCDFDPIGDILSRPFSVQQVRRGKIEQVAIVNP